MLARLAQESGIETSTAEDLARLDRKRKRRRSSRTILTGSRRATPRPKISQDEGRHEPILAYKPEHAVDLDTGAVVAAELSPGRRGTDTTTLEKMLAAAKSLRIASRRWKRHRQWPKTRPNV